MNTAVDTGIGTDPPVISGTGVTSGSYASPGATPAGNSKSSPPSSPANQAASLDTSRDDATNETASVAHDHPIQDGQTSSGASTGSGIANGVHPSMNDGLGESNPKQDEDDDDDDMYYMDFSTTKPSTSGASSAPDPPGTGMDTGNRADDDTKIEKDISPSPSPLPPPSECNRPSPQPQDLVHLVKGLRRILDLVKEEGSGGLVDKIIIDQKSFGQFINDICPGAYASVTKVKFAALDEIRIKPLGIYGSQSEIVNFLASKNVVNDRTADFLQHSCDDPAKLDTPRLRSGIYLLRIEENVDDSEEVYVIYWPQDTTWDDDAISSVRRNRVTFMRYLTRIAHQVVALVSSEHASRIVWKDTDEPTTDEDEDQDEAEFDRVFDLEVTKTKEETEDAHGRDGFTFQHQAITDHLLPYSSSAEPTALAPKLLSGDSTIGFMSSEYLPPTENIRHYNEECYALRLQSICTSESLIIKDSVSHWGFELLLKNGLQSRAPDQAAIYLRRSKEILEEESNKKQSRMSTLSRKLGEKKEHVKLAVEIFLTRAGASRFPHIGLESSAGSDKNVDKGSSGTDLGDKTATKSGAGVHDFLSKLLEHPPTRKVMDDASCDTRLWKISSYRFQDIKRRIWIIDYVLHQSNFQPDPADLPAFIDTVLGVDDLKMGLSMFMQNDDSSRKSWPNWFLSLASKYSTKEKMERLDKLLKQASNVENVDFLQKLRFIVDREPLLAAPCSEASRIAREAVLNNIQTKATSVSERVIKIHEEKGKIRLEQEARSKCESEIRKAMNDFVIETRNLLTKASESTLAIAAVEELKLWSSSGKLCRVVGSIHSKSEARVKHTVYIVLLTEQDRQRLQMDTGFVPTPRINTNFTSKFELPISSSIQHIRVLEDQRCLLLFRDSKGDLSIYMEPLMSIGSAIERSSFKKKINQDRLGDLLLTGYNESKRMLALCVASKAELKLHVFVFDEHFGALQGFGSPVNLRGWYETQPAITHLILPCGDTEEVVLVDHGRHARIYSLVTQQFRPTSLTFPEAPVAIYPSPDCSCLFAVFTSESGSILRAYHWSNFGSSEGVSILLNDLPLQSTTLSSLVKRTNVHFVTIDSAEHRCQSVALQITQKSTEFSLQDKSSKRNAIATDSMTARNCLVDCHAEVWTRFPVVPAVQRRAIHTADGLQPHALVLVTDKRLDAFKAYWSNLIFAFERNTRKPTEEQLSSIRVWSTTFSSYSQELGDSISSFLAGEWLVDLLCLIPIHLAVTRENRFIPLKDGVLSADLERSLLGASVGQIIDAISIGWYESIFSSYMASKAVKVVSSMGEQSVGKSFALNHLVDTSFAGSAMRTTEGVWMSVNPTEDELIVALDFEGVHSIERSAQEDTLLVLFNTAISNLVLFRNNFALSRDIAGLFQSFQSSSSVLDPAANPSLFKSTLVIIIKDVTDSDSREITKEFSLKFSQIVHQEQAANFISRLHDGKMTIIPWPVIESKEFYTMFPIVKKRLDKQRVTHPRAGVFLHTLKTLMAKLKANDWGALSQNLAAHRAQQIQLLLPIALAFGVMEIDPQVEPLKNLDTNEPIGGMDRTADFYLSELTPRVGKSFDKGQMFHTLRTSWPDDHLRRTMPDDEWIENLSNHLSQLTTERIEVVQKWIDINTSRFAENTASIDPLKREFNRMAGDLKASVQLCKMKCANCYLLCVDYRHHDSVHNCFTKHRCPNTCHYKHESLEGSNCGLPAGHPDVHICEVSEHLCGILCNYAGKGGCMGNCVKAAKHELDSNDKQHMCQARFHECGESCSLANVLQADGTLYSCPERCRIPLDQLHETHDCQNRSCSLSCQLCGRLCAEDDHLHGLLTGATHLCGQSHPCPHSCAAKGVCHIETAPQSVEVTFTGRHERFQYTKYSQVSKRLACVISIPPGEVSHQGPHTHSTDSKVFHFCETKCEFCGYYCTLPLGHAQDKHETSHGSMSQTRWAVDGPDGTTVELDGRKFGASDEGAPMMCSMVCRSMGRHVHIDFCRSANPDQCSGSNLEHIAKRMVPSPDKPKDLITHALYWQRTGFKDPYSNEDQVTFAKCDSMCSGSEHQPDAQGHAQPSYCTLPIFHPPRRTDQVPAGGGYVSGDGHLFNCRNPFVMQQAFHVIFVIDRSGSMDGTDRRPLPNTPVSARIAARSNNRVGAVYSALHAFWSARHAAIEQAAPGVAAVRRDAYSVVLFDHAIDIVVQNDFVSSPSGLLDLVLPHGARGGTNYTQALTTSQSVMERNWSTERSPVVVFLSDGECSVEDVTVQDIGRRAIALGRGLSFHAVSFGPSNAVLRRMVQIASDIQSQVPPDPMHPAVPSSYNEALDSVRLAETFLGIADSLRKPRGSLVRA